MKPHIKKVNGLWSCEGHTSSSPRNAYFMWQFKAATEQEYKKFIEGLPKPRERQWPPHWAWVSVS